MTIVSNLFLMISGACLALGIIHFRFWLADRLRRDYLAFAISCFALSIFSLFELAMMHSSTPEEYLYYAWWAQYPATFSMVSVAWFAYLKLYGRRWLFWMICASRALVLILHNIFKNGVNFREVTGLGHVTILGETLTYAIAIPNQWQWLAQLSHILLIVLCFEASIRVWKRGEHRQAKVFGTGIVLFGVTSLILTVAVLWGFLHLPNLASLSFFFIIAAMVEQINYELQSTAMLSRQLLEREAQLRETLLQLNLSAGAANVGLWTRIVGENVFLINEKAGEIWGYKNGEKFGREDFLERVHPDDKERVLANIKDLEERKNEFQLEYRVFKKDGNVRWVNSQGKVEQVNETRIIRGAIVDVTKRKVAEEAIHELSRRLINAQEKERARLARELHDDLSQSLALLSIQLSQLRKEPVDWDFLNNQVDQLVSGIARLSADMHRISHELHPAKLSQLGLELALRGFCRELSSAHPIKIEFHAENLPRVLPDDVSLCLYRVTQESLQNVIKHSNASNAHVDIKLESDEICLLISDDGSGFDTRAGKGKESLGLISIDERVRAINGTVEIDSAIGEGTRIRVRVPFKQTA